MKEIETKEGSGDDVNKRSKNWVLVLVYIYLHVLGIVGLYFLFVRAKWMTVFYFLFLIITSAIALTAGAHRLYAHQTFVASWQVRFFVMLAHTLAGVGPLHDWVFWHRMHHKYYGTERDPYNHKKGFLYAHVFSNFLSAPSDLSMYARDIDMRDVETDGYVWTQRKFYWIFFLILGILLPINMPIEYWGESLVNSFLIIGITRLAITTNISWLVNSSLLVWGLKKNDKLIPIFDTISLLYRLFFKMPKSHGTVLISGDGIRYKFPIDDNSVFFLSKSYWLNYHYLVPWDWKNDEFGPYESGFITFIIKMWRELGVINEMKTVSTEDVRDALYKIATSKMTLNKALMEIKEKAEETAYKQKLMYHH